MGSLFINVKAHFDSRYQIKNYDFIILDIFMILKLSFPYLLSTL